MTSVDDLGGVHFEVGIEVTMDPTLLTCIKHEDIEKWRDDAKLDRYFEEQGQYTLNATFINFHY